MFTSLHGGAALQDQVQYYDVLSLIKAHNVTAVIIQEQSFFLAIGQAWAQQATYPAASEIVQAVKSQKPSQKVILFETWGYLSGDVGHYGLGDTFESMQARLETGYDDLAQYLGNGVQVCHIGSGPWSLAYQALGSKANLLYVDYEHPSPLGTYVAALGFFKHLFNKTATRYIPPGLSKGDARMAHQWVYESSP